ncbi:hypothetical protein [Butyricicoccus intestinisimiae]|uniref:Uncharacterized protein n=1 Tax=Butyricicoccus intestinisimiae TaxID=2841509 RepID=A0ABS6EST5_9FIRM|nr:hypothetical protein [Butyricicoccus intestinisimiae]MBU5490550.1 hypothetical protein [Butyricicoccus intestinisimiae]
MRKTKAFLFEEGGTAQAVTEGAAREQVRMQITWFVKRTVRTGFLALPLGELAFAGQMTERAAHRQVRVRANLKNYVSWYLPSLSLRDISPKGRDKFGLCVRGSPPSLSLLDISPKGRDKIKIRTKKLPFGSFLRSIQILLFTSCRTDFSSCP